MQRERGRRIDEGLVGHERRREHDGKHRELGGTVDGARRDGFRSNNVNGGADEFDGAGDELEHEHERLDRCGHHGR